MDKNRLKKDLSASLRQVPSVLAAYLFGSTAAGIEREGSDVDIAVYLDEKLNSSRMMEVRFHLLDIFGSLYDREVDVVVLNRASLKMIHQVLYHGELIYDRDPERTLAFALQRQKEYFDFKYYIDKDIQQMRTFFGCQDRGDNP
ncbi:MAG: nucleotidyltransferase domain-containing protein [Pseudomonadota bacterium]